ncbi:MAG: helix-turn-helix domain-containing protein [Actinobacteria bacterium]|nr:helix-turn-helix domain-containing protein [Actinomycetota bacterium]
MAELAEVREALRRTNPTAAEQERIDDAFDRALRMRELHFERSRREQELRALIETVASLAALREPDAVLWEICRRARSLLSADAAWITLVDPESGDTYHRATDGIVADEPVRRIRLSEGVGLGGLVLQTGTAEWTDDYLADQRFTHTHTIDGNAKAEGFEAMLGAPLKRGDELLGIVIAANRGKRSFTPNDVRLLQTLADHAALALSNVQLLSGVMTASEALREASWLSQVNAELAEQAIDLQGHLSKLALDGAKLNEMISAIAESLDGRAVVLDYESHVVAAAGAPEEETLPVALVSTVAATPEGGKSFQMSAAGGEPARLVVPMQARSESLGTLLLSKHSPQDGDLQLLESAALPVALSIANGLARAQAESVVRGELLDDLIGGVGNDEATLLRRADKLGWDPNREFVVGLVDLGDRQRRWTRLRLSQTAAARGGLMSERDGLLVLVLPSTEADSIGAEVERALAAPGDEQPATIAISRATSGIESVADTYEESRQALQLALALGRTGQIVLAEEADTFGIVFGSAQPHQLERFIERVLGPVLRYDQERGAELLTTLEVWFANDGNMTNTAKAAFVHTNTLYKRMARISELLGEDWREPDDARLQLQLALRLRQVGGRLGRIESALEVPARSDEDGNR